MPFLFFRVTISTGFPWYVDFVVVLFTVIPNATVEAIAAIPVHRRSVNMAGIIFRRAVALLTPVHVLSRARRFVGALRPRGSVVTRGPSPP